MVKKILAQYDYKRCLSKLVNTKVKVMKLSKKDARSDDVNLSPQELNGIKKSFQNMFTQLKGIMTRILECKLTDEENRLFFLGERLDRIMLPKVLLEEEEEDEEDTDVYFEEYFEIVRPIDCPKHAVTQVDKHVFAERKIYVNNRQHKLYFCNCGVSYVINEQPYYYFVVPDLKKDGKQKVLYDIEDEECGFTFVKRGIWKQGDYDIQDWIIPFEYKKSKD
ncbi:predicted protein [Naegleria gruberi]|uniref:Predicted protein n=1 Tax=Naegleria gruberi TaxID=5762 RepID=D2VIH2_NAEGR|nr:uncharacterized protein NAEGRDRAFT_68681 [Naegleria gruberi]EFC43357.1 predicted protein [Naegleria gruberi]|eukprot:XP_002676101.1 predicted protein [Naegleria gruberi strain NEG-M]